MPLYCKVIQKNLCYGSNLMGDTAQEKSAAMFKTKENKLKRNVLNVQRQRLKCRSGGSKI